MLRNYRLSRFEDYLGWDVTVFLLGVACDILLLAAGVYILLWLWDACAQLKDDIRKGRRR